MEDDGPDEAEGELRVAVDDVLTADVDQLDLLVPQEPQRGLHVLDGVKPHPTSLPRLKIGKLESNMKCRGLEFNLLLRGLESSLYMAGTAWALPTHITNPANLIIAINVKRYAWGLGLLSSGLWSS